MDTGSNERCSLCMCYCLLPQPHNNSGRFSRKNVVDSICGAPFEGIVGTNERWNNEVKLCDYCNTFVFDFVMRNRKKRHPLHMVIDHIISGACSVPAPSKTQLARWVNGMDAKHPILVSTRYGEFNNRIHAIRSIDPDFSLSSVSLVRWLFEGATHLFNDMVLGRNIRRAVSDPMLHRFWEAWPSPCRKCATALENVGCFTDFSGYSSALLFAGITSMQSEFETTIERQPVVAGLTLFCLRCNQVSAISFEYESALRSHFNLPQQTSGGHYAHIAMRYRTLLT